MTYSTERFIDIVNNETDSRYRIGPDRDGLDMVEIISISEDGVLGNSICATKDVAILIAKSILELYAQDVKIDSNLVNGPGCPWLGSIEIGNKVQQKE